eukprot:UN16716
MCFIFLALTRQNQPTDVIVFFINKSKIILTFFIL